MQTEFYSSSYLPDKVVVVDAALQRLVPDVDVTVGREEEVLQRRVVLVDVDT